CRCLTAAERPIATRRNGPISIGVLTTSSVRALGLSRRWGRRKGRWTFCAWTLARSGPRPTRPPFFCVRAKWRKHERAGKKCQPECGENFWKLVSILGSQCWTELPTGRKPTLLADHDPDNRYDM